MIKGFLGYALDKKFCKGLGLCIDMYFEKCTMSDGFIVDYNIKTTYPL
jgi:hypothetical protein